VGLVLSADAQTAFSKAGSQKLTFGSHILAVRLHVLDAKGSRLRLFVAATHAPDFKHKQAEKDEYTKNLGKYLDACGPNEILVMVTSCHGRLGVSGDVRGSDEVGSNSYNSVLGKWAWRNETVTDKICSTCVWRTAYMYPYLFSNTKRTVRTHIRTGKRNTS